MSKSLWSTPGYGLISLFQFITFHLVHFVKYETVSFRRYSILVDLIGVSQSTLFRSLSSDSHSEK